MRTSKNSSRVLCLLSAPLTAVSLQIYAATAMADTHEMTQFSVPSGSPDEDMQAGAAFARELDPDAEISFRNAQSGSLSVSRVEGARIRCIVRVAPEAAEALKPLGRFLDGRMDRRTQTMFALAHEIGHCKVRDAFLSRPDGRVADSSVFPFLAQETAADAYGILSVERKLGDQVPVRQAVVLSRMLASAMYRDPAHATGHYVSEALRLCEANRTDADAVRCSVSTAYYVAGSLANDEAGSRYSVDSPPRLIYELGLRKMSATLHVYDDIAQYKAHFAGADLTRFAFNEVSRHGETRYITAELGQETEVTYPLADFYGFKAGKIVTQDARNVAVLRIDGADELDWLLTLGAVVRTEDGTSLRKGDAAPRR